MTEQCRGSWDCIRYQEREQRSWEMGRVDRSWLLLVMEWGHNSEVRECSGRVMVRAGMENSPNNLTLLININKIIINLYLRIVRTARSGGSVRSTTLCTVAWSTWVVVRTGAGLIKIITINTILIINY